MEKASPISTTVSEINFQSARSKIVEDDYDIDSILKKPRFHEDSEFSEKVVELIEKHSNNVNKCNQHKIITQIPKMCCKMQRWKSKKCKIPLCKTKQVR